ncbi:MAG TPA: hypothetical protein VGW58_08080 [Pyrinomonadaceae bacterium]|nr:hypothetical protein [Pyrinomonadaceae bacterium]
MRVLPGFQRNCHKRGLFAASSLLLLLATQTVAQSGRRAPKPAQPPTATPDTDNKQPAIANGRELTRKTSLVVAKQQSSKHLLSEDAIFANFVKRLGEFKNVSVTSLGDLKHDAAVKRAKSENEAIVVLVEFDVDEFQKGTLILNSPDLEVKVLVFAPHTGKKRFEGNVYYKAVGGPMLKKDNWPSGTPIRITTEAVGIEAAEQVRDWLIVEERRVKN